MSLTPLYSASAFGVTTPDNLMLLINLDESALGPTAPQVAKAVRHLCGLLFKDEELKPIPLDNYYEVAKNYYEECLRADPMGRQALSLLAYVSAYFHEIRHVHDLLSTAYGQAVLLKNFKFYLNVPSLIGALAEWQGQATGRVVPLPLAQTAAEVQGLPGDINTLLTLYPAEQLEIAALQEPSYGFHGGLTVTHLLECIAANIQLSFVNDVFGSDALAQLSEFIQSGPASRTYLQMSNDLIESFRAKNFRGSGVGTLINYLAWCALQGTTRPGHKRSEGMSPVILYEALAEHIIRKAGELTLPAIRDLVLDFCRQWDLQPPDEMVTRVQLDLETPAAKLEAALRGQADSAGFRVQLAADYKRLVHAYAGLTGWIMAHPEEYFGNYVWAVMYGVLPSVRVLFKMNGAYWYNVSPGYELIPLESWDRVSYASTTMTFLLEGRSDSPTFPFSFMEDDTFKHLTAEEINGVRLKFRSRRR